MRPTDEIICRELVELVTDYLEGTLGEDETSRFEEHLVMCEGCAAYLEQMRTTVRLAGEPAELPLDPGTREQLLAAFRDWRRSS